MTRLNLWRMLLILTVLAMLPAGCLATPLTVVDPALVGTWQGTCEIGVPVLFDPSQLPEGVERTHQSVALTVTIHEDASVDGSLGDATFEECVLKANRNDLGRSLNIASDYIVIDGFLSGAIVPDQDETDVKNFTIPFDLVEGKIEGGLMWVAEGKYPFPLCSPANLTRSE
ncbi:MAG: hypothetical protein KDD84_20505 [Caldilineaceae bacterium]|nr:hypothetical protein [Caldilineaceae bacterium]